MLFGVIFLLYDNGLLVCHCVSFLLQILALDLSKDIVGRNGDRPDVDLLEKKCVFIKKGGYGQFLYTY